MAKPNFPPDRKLFVITNIETGEDGKPFALCKRHFDLWAAKDRVLWRVIGDRTPESCNECDRDNHPLDCLTSWMEDLEGKSLDELRRIRQGLGRNVQASERRFLDMLIKTTKASETHG